MSLSEALMWVEVGIGLTVLAEAALGLIVFKMLTGVRGQVPNDKKD